ITVKDTAITLAQSTVASVTPISIADLVWMLNIDDCIAASCVDSDQSSLLTNTSGDATHDDFAIVATDLDLQASPNATLQINIKRSEERRVGKDDRVAATTYNSKNGNVITVVDTTNACADTLVADGRMVAGVKAS